jgi:hypothetical protein
MASVFFDSGVLIEAIRSRWGAAKAIFVLASYRVLDLETSALVVAEVEAALGRFGEPTGPGSEYAQLLRLTHVRIHPPPDPEMVREGLRLYLPATRHRADVPILVAAREAHPDWMVSSNRRHFGDEVARLTGLRIVSPQELMRYLDVRDVPVRGVPKS